MNQFSLFKLNTIKPKNVYVFDGNFILTLSVNKTSTSWVVTPSNLYSVLLIISIDGNIHWPRRKVTSLRPSVTSCMWSFNGVSSQFPRLPHLDDPFSVWSGGCIGRSVPTVLSESPFSFDSSFLSTHPQ